MYTADQSKISSKSNLPADNHYSQDTKNLEFLDSYCHALNDTFHY